MKLLTPAKPVTMVTTSTMTAQNDCTTEDWGMASLTKGKNATMEMRRRRRVPRRLHLGSRGDGILDPGEECDDGNAVDEDVPPLAKEIVTPPLCPHPRLLRVRLRPGVALGSECGLRGGRQRKTARLDLHARCCGQPNNPDPPCAGLPSVENEEGYGNVFQIDRTGGGRNDYIGQSNLGDVSNCEELIRWTPNPLSKLVPVALDAREWPVGVRILYTADEPDSDGDDSRTPGN